MYRAKTTKHSTSVAKTPRVIFSPVFSELFKGPVFSDFLLFVKLPVCCSGASVVFGDVVLLSEEVFKTVLLGCVEVGLGALVVS